MLKRGLRILLLGVICLHLSGCRQEKIPDWMNEGKDLFAPEPVSPSEIIIVSSVLQPLQLPADTDLYQMPFWTDPIALEPDPISANAARLGFPPSQVQTWQENGLIVKVAPMTHYNALIQSLLDAGAVLGDQTTNLYRNPMEIADYFGLPLYVPTSLFIQGPDGSVSSYELTQGYPTFRISCQPWRMNTQNRIVNVRISPQHHLPTPPIRYELDPTGLPQPVMDQPRIVFDQITLAGLIPPDHFICLSCRKPSEESTVNVGELFLKRDVGAENYQLVYLILPKIQIARRADRSF